MKFNRTNRNGNNSVAPQLFSTLIFFFFFLEKLRIVKKEEEEEEEIESRDIFILFITMSSSKLFRNAKVSRFEERDTNVRHIVRDEFGRRFAWSRCEGVKFPCIMSSVSVPNAYEAWPWNHSGVMAQPLESRRWYTRFSISRVWNERFLRWSTMCVFEFEKKLERFISRLVLYISSLYIELATK